MAPRRRTTKADDPFKDVSPAILRVLDEDRMEVAMRARRAVSAAHRRTMELTGYLRAVTHDDEAKIEWYPGTPCTDGKVVKLRPPIEWGDDLKHDKTLCGQRDEDLVLRCETCRIQEDVNITLRHEIGHIVGGSFEPVSDEDRVMILREGLKEFGVEDGSSRAAKIDAAIRDALTRDRATHLDAMKVVSPWLPVITNALEDVRVNIGMFNARPGLHKQFAAQAAHVLRNGFTKPTGEVVPLREYPDDIQACIALFTKVAGYDYEKWVKPEIAEALKDRRLERITERVRAARNVSTVVAQAFPALEVLRDHGFCTDKNDAEDDEPEPEEGPGEPCEDGEASDQTPQEESGDSDGDGETGESSGQGATSKTARSDAPSDESDDDAADEPSETNAQNEDDSDESDTGNGDESDKTDESEPSLRDGDKSDTDELDDESNGSGGESDEESDDNDDDSSGESEDDGDDGDAEADGEDAGGNGEADGDADDESELNNPDYDYSDADPDTYGDDDDDEWDDDDGDLDADAYDDDDESLGDGEQDGGEGSAAAQEAQEVLDQLGGHTETGIPGVGGEDRDLTPEDRAISEEIDRAIVQESFDCPAVGVWRVQEWFDGDGRAPSWDRQYAYNPPSLIEPPESVLGPALMEMRITFADNKRADHQKGLKSGRINTRALGTRFIVDDPRLFQKKRLPGKRDYFVVLGLDVSGSTCATSYAMDGTHVQRVEVIKAAAYAQAELLHRMGIKFAVYAHTSHSEHYTRGSTLDILVVKSPHDAWDNKAKERLAKLASGNGNLDGHTIEYYRKVAQAQPQTDKLVLYYTDGAMPAENTDEEREVLIRECADQERNGVKLIGVGVECDSPTQYGLDTIRLDSLNDVGKVVRELKDRLV